MASRSGTLRRRATGLVRTRGKRDGGYQGKVHRSGDPGPRQPRLPEAHDPLSVEG